MGIHLFGNVLELCNNVKTMFATDRCEQLGHCVGREWVLPHRPWLERVRNRVVRGDRPE